MKWNKYYQELYFCDDIEADGCTGLMGVINAMCFETPIQASFVTVDMVDENNSLISDKFEAQEPINLILKSIVVTSRRKMSLEIKVRTRGILPRGIKHGNYTFCVECGMCNQLPPEMFEDEDTKKDNLN